MVLIAVGQRLTALSDPVPALGEALAARSAWDFALGGLAEPFTGDLTAALAALLLRLHDDSIVSVRLPAALFGVAAVAALSLFRGYVGRAACLIGALLLALSPLAIASSRALNPDMAGLTLGLLALWLALRIGCADRVWQLPALGLVTGLGLAAGSVAVALLLVAAAHTAIEIGWAGRDDLSRRWRAAVADQPRLAAALLLLALGVGASALRFGAGADRLTIAGLRDWTVPADAAATTLPWHSALVLPAVYEPVAVILGVAGAVLLLTPIFRRWAPDAGPAGRLLLCWLGVSLLLAATALHERPGQVVAVALPLMLLAGVTTSWALTTATGFRPRGGGLALLACAVLTGFLALRLLSWVNFGRIPNNPDTAGALVAAIAVVALVVWTLVRSRGAAGAIAATVVWLLAGGYTVNAAQWSASSAGAELYRVGRPLSARQSLVGVAHAATLQGQSVAIERSLAAPLAWELRGTPVQLYVGGPSPAAIVIDSGTGLPPGGYLATREPVSVETRWRPSGWDGLGVLRWTAKRLTWGPSATLTGRVAEQEIPGANLPDQR